MSSPHGCFSKRSFLPSSTHKRSFRSLKTELLETPSRVKIFRNSVCSVDVQTEKTEHGPLPPLVANDKGGSCLKLQVAYWK